MAGRWPALLGGVVARESRSHGTFGRGLRTSVGTTHGQDGRRLHRPPTKPTPTRPGASAPKSEAPGFFSAPAVLAAAQRKATTETQRRGDLCFCGFRTPGATVVLGRR